MRRWALVGGVLAAALLAAAPALAASTPDQARYVLRLRYEAAAHALGGTETITFRNAGTTALPAVWLRLWPNGYASCGHPLIRLKILHGGRPGLVRSGCTALQVRLPRPLRPGWRASIQLSFRAVASHMNDRFGRSGSATMLGNAIPILAVRDRAGLHVEPYTTLGEAFYSLAASWDVRLDLPRGLEAATTGQEIRTRLPLARGARRLFIAAPRARDFGIVVGSFRIRTVQAGSVRIRYFEQIPDPKASLVRDLLETARDAVRAYTSWYGPYGARELDIAEGRFATFGGMEYPELVMANADLEVVGHELAHQWWYGIVGNNEWSEPWLDESFAVFSQGRFANALAYCDTGDPLHGSWPGARLDAGMGYYNANPQDYDDVVYRGGACVLESLRRQFGDGRFDAFMRSYGAAHRFSVATTADFVAALRKAAPAGFDTAGFLRRARLTA